MRITTGIKPHHRLGRALRLLVLAPLALLLASQTAATALAEDFGLLSERAISGEPFAACARFPAEGASDIRFTLRGPDLWSAGRQSVLVRGRGFAFSEGRGSLIVVWPAALPCYAERGKAQLEVSCVVNGTVFCRTITRPLETRPYNSEEVPLTPSAGEVRGSSGTKAAQEGERLLRAAYMDLSQGQWLSTGRFRIPIAKPRITSDYGDRRVYVYPDGKRDTGLHYGIDYGAAEGTPVLACGNGRVLLSRFLPTEGNVVVLSHAPGFVSAYFHMSALLAREGDYVRGGQRIGLVGATGFATGAHLHWELRLHGVAIEPRLALALPVLDKGRIMATLDGTVR
jgi:hypothetical protein